jgi:hypothetical protein
MRCPRDGTRRDGDRPAHGDPADEEERIASSPYPSAGRTWLGVDVGSALRPPAYRTTSSPNQPARRSRIARPAGSPACRTSVPLASVMAPPIHASAGPPRWSGARRGRARRRPDDERAPPSGWRSGGAGRRGERGKRVTTAPRAVSAAARRSPPASRSGRNGPGVRDSGRSRAAINPVNCPPDAAAPPLMVARSSADRWRSVRPGGLSGRSRLGTHLAIGPGATPGPIPAAPG